MSGSRVGKNSLPKTSVAAVVYRKKSYHSRDVPTRLATITRRAWEVEPAIASLPTVLKGFVFNIGIVEQFDKRFVR
ncbi:hypothetical protein GCM10010149_78740 [Nonomuraea roseoviolacea subsp. roseoviolacea]